MLRPLPASVAAWAALAGLYGLFAGQVSGSEVLAGGIAATAASAFAVLQRRVGGARAMRLRAPWPLLLGGVARSLGQDAVRVGQALALAIARAHRAGEMGAVAGQAFRAGSDDPTDAGRRGLVTLAVSLPPNGYVLDVATGNDGLRIHRLAPTPPKRDPDWPV